MTYKKTSIQKPQFLIPPDSGFCIYLDDTFLCEKKSLDLSVKTRPFAAKSILPLRSKIFRYSTLVRLLSSPFATHRNCTGLFETRRSYNLPLCAAIGFFIPEMKEKCLCVAHGRDLFLFTSDQQYHSLMFTRKLDSFVSELKTYPFNMSRNNYNSTCVFPDCDTLLLITVEAHIIVMRWESYQKCFVKYFYFKFTPVDSSYLQGYLKGALLFKEHESKYCEYLEQKNDTQTQSEVSLRAKHAQEKFFKVQSLYYTIEPSFKRLAVSCPHDIVYFLSFPVSHVPPSPSSSSISSAEFQQKVDATIKRHSQQEFNTEATLDVVTTKSVIQQADTLAIYPGRLVSCCWFHDLGIQCDKTSTVTAFGVLSGLSSTPNSQKLLSLYYIPQPNQRYGCESPNILFPSIQVETPETSSVLTSVAGNPQLLVILGDFGFYIFRFTNYKLQFCYSLISKSVRLKKSYPFASASSRYEGAESLSNNYIKSNTKSVYPLCVQVQYRDYLSFYDKETFFKNKRWRSGSFFNRSKDPSIATTLFCASVDYSVVWGKPREHLWLPNPDIGSGPVVCPVLFLIIERKKKNCPLFISFLADKHNKLKTETLPFKWILYGARNCFTTYHFLPQRKVSRLLFWKYIGNNIFILILGQGINAVYTLKCNFGESEDGISKAYPSTSYNYMKLPCSSILRESSLAIIRDSAQEFEKFTSYVELFLEWPPYSCTFLRESLYTVTQWKNFTPLVTGVWIFPLFSRERKSDLVYLCCICTYEELLLIFHTRETWTTASLTKSFMVFNNFSETILSISVYIFESLNYLFFITSRDLMVIGVDDTNSLQRKFPIHELISKPSGSVKLFAGHIKDELLFLLLENSGAEAFLFKLKDICSMMHYGTALNSVASCSLESPNCPALSTLSASGFAFVSAKGYLCCWSQKDKSLSSIKIKDIHLSTIALAPDGSMVFCGSLCGRLLVYTTLPQQDTACILDQLIEENQIIRTVCILEISHCTSLDGTWIVLIHSLHCFCLTVHGGTIDRNIRLVSGLTGARFIDIKLYEGNHACLFKCFGVAYYGLDSLVFGFLCQKDAGTSIRIPWVGVPTMLWQSYQQCPHNPRLLVIFAKSRNQQRSNRICLAYLEPSSYSDIHAPIDSDLKPKLRYIFSCNPLMPRNSSFSIRFDWNKNTLQTTRKEFFTSAHENLVVHGNPSLLLWDSIVRSQNMILRASFVGVVVSYPTSFPCVESRNVPSHYNGILFLFSYNTSFCTRRYSFALRGSIGSTTEETAQNSSSWWCKKGTRVECLAYWYRRHQNLFLFVRHHRLIWLNAWVPFATIELDDVSPSLSLDDQKKKIMSRISSAQDTFLKLKLKLHIPFDVKSFAITENSRYLAIAGRFNVLIFGISYSFNLKKKKSPQQITRERLDFLCHTQLQSQISKIQWINSSPQTHEPNVTNKDAVYFISVVFSLHTTEILRFDSQKKVLHSFSSTPVGMNLKTRGFIVPKAVLPQSVRNMLYLGGSFSSKNPWYPAVLLTEEIALQTSMGIESGRELLKSCHGEEYKMLVFAFQSLNESTQHCLSYLLDLQTLLLGLSLELQPFLSNCNITEIYQMARRKAQFNKPLSCPANMLLFLFYIHFLGASTEEIQKTNGATNELPSAQQPRGYEIKHDFCNDCPTLQWNGKRLKHCVISKDDLACEFSEANALFLEKLAYTWLMNEERQRALVTVLRIATLCDQKAWNALREDIYPTGSSYWASRSISYKNSQGTVLEHFLFFGYMIPHIKLYPWAVLDLDLLKSLFNLSPLAMKELEDILTITQLDKHDPGKRTTHTLHDIRWMIQELIAWAS